MFDNDISCMLDRDSPEGREIRRLAKQRAAKTPFERKNGVYTLSARIVPPEKLNAKDKARVKPVDAQGDAIMTSGKPTAYHSVVAGFPRQGP